MTSLRVAVIAGGPSTEANVSRASAGAVSDALAEAGHAPEIFELLPDLGSALLRAAPEVVFPVTHGAIGEDGCLQGMLEVLGFPYVGSGVLASALAASKPHAKFLFYRSGLPLAADAEVRPGDDLGARAKEIRKALGPSVVVKPASGGSAIATSRIDERASDADLVAAFERALEVDSRVLVERFVAGAEVTCGVLDDDTGPFALPPTLVLSKAADWYDFTSRYQAGGSEHRCPAPFSSAIVAEVQRVAVAAFSALGCRDLARADFVVDETSEEHPVTLLEINTLPGMTATSLYPEAAAVAGISFPALCDRFVRGAHARPRRAPPTALPMP